MMKTIFKKSITLVIVLFFCSKIFANGITISNVSFLPTTNQIQFDVSWENSWRSDVLQNWDAAYIFAKFKNQNGNWEDIKFLDTGYVVPLGYSLYTLGDVNGLGTFLYRSATGNGTSTLTGVKLKIYNSNVNGSPYVVTTGGYDVKVFGIEMVYIPQGPFWAGDNASISAFKPLTGGFPSLYVNSDKLEYLSNPNGITNFDPNTASLYLNSTGSFYPTGYKAFYCMKYEISQGAYRDFLNSLNITQQSNHIAASTLSSPGTGAFGSFLNSASIKIMTSGSAAGPAVFGCDANNNNIYNEAGDGEWVSCNYLTWPDVAAYLMWAGLNTMTELQFEKICRGPLQPVANEYAWGNTSIASGNLTFANAYQVNEIVSNASTTLGNANYNSVFNNPNVRPSRNGVFATATTNRTTSGGAFYGVMDMSGNLWERVVTVSKLQGIGFKGFIGFGSAGLSPLGFSVDNSLPGGGVYGSTSVVDGTRPALGLMYRGGAHDSPSVLLKISERGNANLITNNDNTREVNLGGRGVYNIIP
jgi:formylglycine-generating enzyme required for sulfatase activity